MRLITLALAFHFLAAVAVHAAPIVHTFEPPEAGTFYFGNALASDANSIYIVSSIGGGYAFDRETYALTATYPAIGPAVKHVKSNGSEVYLGSWPATVDGMEKVGFGAIYDATTGDLKYKIENPTPEVDERFGNWAAPFGDEWLVGAYKSNDQTFIGGAAFVFADGVLQQTILDPSIPDGQFDRFGYTVGATADFLAVGAYRDSEIVTGAGAVHVFDHDGQWLRTINNPEPESADLFGSSMATKGHYAIVGAFEDDGPTVDDTGSVFLVDLASGEILLKIDNPEPADDRFGWKVAFVGDNIAVGNWDNDEQPGENRVYVFDGVTGELLDAMSDPLGTTGNFFGFEIAGVGTDLIVGADESNGQRGLAYLYDGSEWQPAVGDSNHDGAVDGADYLRWATNFGAVDPRGPVDGDFNYDGQTDPLDYLLWAGNASIASAVPEPGTLSLLVVTIVCACCRRGPRRRG